MNKKFSTLMAGLLLATAFGTASAQSIPSSLGNFAKYATVPAEEVIDMEKGYVQLAVATPGSDGKAFLWRLPLVVSTTWLLKQSLLPLKLKFAIPCGRLLQLMWVSLVIPISSRTWAQVSSWVSTQMRR